MSPCPARAAMTDLPLALAMRGESMATGYDEGLAYANKHRRLCIAVTCSTVDPRPRRFEGIGNIRTAAGKCPTVRIGFPVDKRSAATSADLAGAANGPLTRSCGSP